MKADLIRHLSEISTSLTCKKIGAFCSIVQTAHPVHLMRHNRIRADQGVKSPGKTVKTPAPATSARRQGRLSLQILSRISTISNLIRWHTFRECMCVTIDMHVACTKGNGGHMTRSHQKANGRTKRTLAKPRPQQSGRWHISLGDQLIRRGRYEQAMSEYHKALKFMLQGV